MTFVPGRWDSRLRWGLRLVAISAVLLFVVCHRTNHPPNPPSVPAGPDSSRPGMNCRFSTAAVDPDDDSVCCQFLWGPGAMGEWSEPVASGDSVSDTLRFTAFGAYSPRARARDVHGDVSEWSEAIHVYVGNSAPETPELDVPDDTFVVGDEVFVPARVFDADSDNLWVQLDWGDGDTTAWEFAEEGQTEFWKELLRAGEHPLRARARDEHGSCSDWSAPQTLVALGASLLWSVGCDAGSSSPAIGPDGTVVVGADQGVLAVNPDGSRKWHCALPRDVAAVSIAADGTIYARCWNDYLYALTSGGSIAWRYPVGGTSVRAEALSIGPEGTIYVPGVYLYALNPDGTLKWRWGTGDSSAAAPAIALDGSLYIIGRDSFLYALNPDNSLRWRYPVPTSRWSLTAPAIGGDGTVYVPGTDGFLHAVRPDGSLRWSTRFLFEGYPDVLPQPTIDAEGTIYVVCAGICAIRADGSMKWCHQSNDEGWTAWPAAIAADGTSYMSYEDVFSASLVAWCADGSRSWINRVFGGCSAPAIAGDGTIYAVSYGLHALAGGSPRAASAWPMAQHDPRHTNWAGTAD